MRLFTKLTISSIFIASPNNYGSVFTSAFMVTSPITTRTKQITLEGDLNKKLFIRKGSLRSSNNGSDDDCGVNHDKCAKSNNKDFIQTCQDTLTTLAITCSFMFSIMNTNSIPQMSTAAAPIPQQQLQQLQLLQPKVILQNVMEQILIQPANAIGDEAITSNTEELTSTTRETISQKVQLERSTVVDEVWTLVDKYFLDQSFHNQDWSTARSTYESQLKIDPINGDYNDEEAMQLATTMVSTLGDKYSRILDKGAYARIQKFDLIGVGATLMPDSIDKRIKVGAPPVDGSEAQKGGIKYADYITAVNGVKTQGRTAFEIIDQLSEEPNAKTITMTVLTEGPDDIKGEGFIRDVTMKRQTMEVKNPISYRISERRKDGTVVGYVRLSEFNSLVESKLKEALSSLRSEGANAYVLDMRSNPGGAFQSAVEIASLFMEDKIATTVVDSNAVEMPFKTAKGKISIDEKSPLVIWIDGGSASATEVLAGALHDQCRASIMGSHSFGKGLIQAVYGLKNGGGLVLTVAKYVTPNGTNIQGSGIIPDVEAKLPLLYLPTISSDTSKVDFKALSTQNLVCPATNEI
jgi:C-terminal peptidase prc